jgi:beta-lactamase superfamily II metal-dependent hydrolase
LVLLGTFRGIRILLLSDLGRAGQEALMQRTADLRADIVVAGLPAQGEALRDTLLAAIQPRAIIICDSDFPASARASPRLRERLAGSAARVIYTRFGGATTIELGRSGWEIRTR